MHSPASAVTVSPLEDELFDAFAHLWVERRHDAGLSREAAQRAVVEGRLERAAHRDGVVVFLALSAGEAVGYAWVYDQATSILLDTPSMAVEELFVLPGSRRRGVARSLLLAVGARAQRCGADHVTASLPNQAREANRIFARLGFAPQVTRRIAPTSLLMRRLRGMEASPLENLMINRRRSLRARGRRQENAYSG